MATLTNIYFLGRDSRCSVFILLYISVVLPLIITIDAEIQNDHRSKCRNDSYYAEGSHFQSNLNTVLHGLVQNTPQSRFNTSVYGQSPDQVYGLLQCRGDTTKDQCNYCSQEANSSIRQYCGKAFGGIIWLDLCYLRYNNSPFIGQLDTYNWWSIYEEKNVSSPEVFRSNLEDLFNELSAKAVYGSSTLYASKTTNNLSPKIFALVQCRRDMSTDNCERCLREVTTYILTEFPGSQGVRCYVGSCIVRYEIYSFFGSPSTAEAPANKPVPTPLSKSTHLNKIPTILGVVGGGGLLLALLVCLLILGVVGGSGLLLALLVCLFTTWRRLNSAMYRRGYEVHEQIEEDTLVCEDRQIVAFKMETLVAATGNFHDDNKLGEGGFGPVYKGAIHDDK